MNLNSEQTTRLRLQVRFQPEERYLIEVAAKYKGKSLNKFINDVALQEAERIIGLESEKSGRET